MIKKPLTDSILLSKGYPKIHNKLMPWRRNTYILLTIEILFSLIYFTLEIIFTIQEGAQNDFFIWILLSVVISVLLEFYEWNVLYLVEQPKLKCCLLIYFFVLINILASSLTQSIFQCLHTDIIVRSNLYFEILSFVCGFSIFLLGVFRLLIYNCIILKFDLKGKEAIIQKAIRFQEMTGENINFTHLNFRKIRNEISDISENEKNMEKDLESLNQELLVK